MSLKLTGWVWDEVAQPRNKLLLLGLAEFFADFDEPREFGPRQRQSLERLTCFGPDEVTAGLRTLEIMGYLRTFGEQPGGVCLMVMLDPHSTGTEATTQTANELMRKRFPKAPAEGYVYLLHGAGHYKIGRAKDPWRRSEQLAIQLPYEVELLDYWYTDDCRTAEREAHQRFAALRLNGEWFNFSAAMLPHVEDTIAEICRRHNVEAIEAEASQ